MKLYWYGLLKHLATVNCSLALVHVALYYIILYYIILYYIMLYYIILYYIIIIIPDKTLTFYK